MYGHNFAHNSFLMKLIFLYTKRCVINRSIDWYAYFLIWMSGSEVMVKNISRFPFLDNYQTFDFLDIFLTITSEPKKILTFISKIILRQIIVTFVCTCHVYFNNLKYFLFN